MEAAQVAAQKKQEAELERLRTQLVFKQHEIEASRRPAPRAPVPSQPAGYSQTQRSDVPRTPRRHPVADPQSPSPQRPLPVPPRISKMRPLLPGFVNAFTVPSPKKGKQTVHTLAFEQRQKTREQALDPPALSPSRGSVRAHTHPQSDEGMEIDADELGGQATVSTHPEVDFHMDSADGAKTPQLISSFSKATTPFDWVNWVCVSPVALLHALGLHVLVIDETTGTRSCDVATCPEYSPAPSRSATAWCRPSGCISLSLHVSDWCGNRLGRV